MEAHGTVTLEEVLGLVRQLSTADKLKVAEHVLVDLEPIVEGRASGVQRSLRGVLKGHTFTEEEIAAARRELWGSVGERDL